jgi:hypothetical protein
VLTPAGRRPPPRAHAGHLEGNCKRIAGSQLAIIVDASHLCFADQPAEFNIIINPS